MSPTFDWHQERMGVRLMPAGRLSGECATGQLVELFSPRYGGGSRITRKIGVPETAALLQRGGYPGSFLVDRSGEQNDFLCSDRAVVAGYLARTSARQIPGNHGVWDPFLLRPYAMAGPRGRWRISPDFANGTVSVSPLPVAVHSQERSRRKLSAAYARP